MINRSLIRGSVLLLLMGCLLSMAIALDLLNIPMPEMVVCKTVVPPTIDGKISPGEWNQAPAATAFVVAYNGGLAQLQTTAYVTYDDNYFYVAIKNLRPEGLTFLAKNGRKSDDAAVVFDPSNEIWFSPPGAPAATYQSLFNTYPAVFDTKMIPSVGFNGMSWSGKWEIASSENLDFWVIEAKAPIKSFGVDGIKDGATWRALFGDDLGDGGGFRAWAAGGGYADITRHGFLHFKDNSPVFQFLDMETLFTGKFSFPMAVTAAPKGSSEVTVTLRFGADKKAAAGDYILTKTVSVADGSHEAFTISGDLTGVTLPLNDAKEKEGYCEVTAKTDDGTTLFYQLFPFMINGFVRKAPTEIKTTPYSTPFGLTAFYAPLSKQLLVKTDRLYMPDHTQVVSGMARLKDPKTGEVVAERKIAPFYFDLSEFTLDLTKLQVPIQTEADWAAANKVAIENTQITKNNATLKASGQPELPLKEVPGVKPAEYTLEVQLTTKDGQALGTTSIPVALMNYQFEWQNNTVGVSDKVIPPWTALKWNNGMLSMWNKSYRLNSLGLAESIINAGKPQLSGQMKLVAVVDGKEVTIKPGKPAMRKLTEAYADLQGVTQFGNLAINVDTHAEFDGFVLNTMTLTPNKPVKLDRLSLVITMPKSEAPCFMTTAGGWSATFGWTPAKWDSRETALGSMIGNFVPYILFTDSERGFCWFADSMKGWILDPAAPTQEMQQKGNLVTLRVNFVSKSGLIEQPTTLKYGWMVTPQKPQPKGWRAYAIDNNIRFPQETCVFWNDADWAVSWPYYSSPYPWDYNKSRQMIAGTENNGVRACVGNIAHAIARYADYKGRPFTEFAADWGIVPGNTGDGNVARSKGPNDFQLWHWDQWVKKSGLAGLYFDENYLGEDWNYLTGGAFKTPDERVQPGYSYLGLRDMDKRLRYMFHDNQKAGPNLWLHTTAGQPVYAWMPDVAMEGENVEPTGMDNDYIDCLSASRLRTIGMGANLGAAPFEMCQADRHWNQAFSPFMVVQFQGWLAAHDVLPEGSRIWPIYAAELQMWRDDIRFLPYWKSGLGIESKTKDVLVSAYTRPGHTMLWIMNTAHADQHAIMQINLKQLGLDAKKTIAFDLETGERYVITNGKLEIAVPQRMWRGVRLQQLTLLTNGLTFFDNFEKADGTANETFGNPNSYFQSRNVKAFVPGKTGLGVSLDTSVGFATRQNLSSASGAVSCQFNFDPATSTGTLLAVDTFNISLNKGKVQVTQSNKLLAEGNLQLPAGWHTLTVKWTAQTLTVSCDATVVITAQLDTPLPIQPMKRAIDLIKTAYDRLDMQQITFGPIKGAVMDDLSMSR